MSDGSREQRPLAVLRAMVDAVDREVLQLLVRRMGIVGEIAGIKREQGLRVRDFKREREILEDRCARAGRLGLAPDEIESLFRVILRASRDYQASLRAELPLDVEPRNVAVIGGRGGMGSLMVRLFGDLGHAVMVADLDADGVARDTAKLAEAADVVVVSVPIDVTEQVIREIGPRVAARGLLMDVTSVKQFPMKAMLESTSASVVGTHPMFGPGVHSLQGQRVVVCPG
ncbi:MAG: prephenate dehydrogenase/arogenate dehydrogenase family protein, partial [Phycisphaerae bacterium]